MSVPRATYRLQFRGETTFGAAAALASYLAALGISHLYASPLFAAAPGSTHGYDGTDFSAMEPDIGGEPGFETLCGALEDAGLGLLLDFVPNHMAAHETNAWWRSVLEWGRDSPHADVFDIDWTAPKLMLPILGGPFDDVLAEGHCRLVFDAAAGSIAFGVYDREQPLTPPSYGLVLSGAGEPALRDIASLFADTNAEDADTLKRQLAELACDPDVKAAIDAALFAAAPDRLRTIHEAQPWRLAFWREARHALTYRRFFEIADLICLRVEDPAVFDAVHARLVELVAAGRVDGVRIDHVDGLADPRGYLDRLQAAAGGSDPLYLLVEKILEPGEKLRADWPIAGTTGYETIAALAGLFVDRDREAEMTAAWRGFTGDASAFHDAARAAKRRMLTHNLEAELNALVAGARTAAGPDAPDGEALREAIVEIAAAFPVYRSYVAETGPDAADRALIGGAAATARDTLQGRARDAIDIVERLLMPDGDAPLRAAAVAFATRFQQTTGPVMAKAVEDTMFYRYNRLIALNEVGGDPTFYGATVEAFHAAMADRLAAQPGGLLATATHDTKRGEDARARLYALSEMPDRWADAVARWSKMTAGWRTALADGPAPEAPTEWLFYQALAGAWPLEEGDDDALAVLRERMRAFMEKAIREAKTRTSWTEGDLDYEKAVDDFVVRALSRSTDNPFLDDFRETCAPVWRAGAVTALSQLAVKLAAPGVPDFYQGTELWDFSLVDPDNRRPVDFAARAALLSRLPAASPEDILSDWRSGAPKFALTAKGLALRTERPGLFAEGAYMPLETTGVHARNLVAFARQRDGDWTVVIAPRLVLTLIEGSERPMVPPDRWEDTAVVLPAGLRGRTVRDTVTGSAFTVEESLKAADALARFPVALLSA